MPKSKSKSAVVEDLDDDLELIEDDEDEAPVKTKKGKAKKDKPAPEPKAESSNTGMGASWLAEYVNEELGTELTAAHVRVILRKLAKDGDLEREVGTDRARYQFTGERDPIVRQVLKRVKGGEGTTNKKDRIEIARAAEAPGKRKAKAVEIEEDEAPAKPRKGKKAKAAEVEEAPVVAKKVRRKRQADDDE